MEILWQTVTDVFSGLNPASYLALVLVVSALCQWAAWYLRVPSILLLLIAGFGLGQLVTPDAVLGRDVLFGTVTVAVGIILFEGSMTLRFRDVRDLGRPVLRLFTLTPLIAWALITLTAWLLGFALELAFLVGAILIVTGPTREIAIQRARRALAEFDVQGIPTVIPFHRAVLETDAFTRDEPFSVYTTWIESEFTETLAALAPAPSSKQDEARNEPAATERVVVEVGGKRLEVVIPAGLNLGGGARRAGARKPARRMATTAASAAGTNSLTSPMQGTIVKIAVEEGTEVAAGDLIVVLEAMKMEQPLLAHRAGRISALSAKIGASVSAGTAICAIID